MGYWYVNVLVLIGLDAGAGVQRKSVLRVQRPGEEPAGEGAGRAVTGMRWEGYRRVQGASWEGRVAGTFQVTLKLVMTSAFPTVLITVSVGSYFAIRFPVSTLLFYCGH